MLLHNSLKNDFYLVIVNFFLKNLTKKQNFKNFLICLARFLSFYNRLTLVIKSKILIFKSYHRVI